MKKHNDSSHFHVLIVAAGSGSRFGGDLPKQYALLGGKTVLRRTIEAFLRYTASVRVVINPEHQDLYKEATKGLSLPAPVFGGTTRKESVAKGIQSFSGLNDNEKILIHDAARPLITQNDIEQVVETLNNHKAVSLGRPLHDTIRKDNNIIDRNGLWALQTPQGFHFKTIADAHKNYGHLEATDDTALVSASGIAVKLIEGSKDNIKITDAHDMIMAEKLIGSTKTRTGMGFDVHAFEKDRKLILCGVEIDHPLGLKGHSDADVGLHALTDALLGTISAGDIGTHFPPSNPEFKNMDSAIFLKKAGDLIKDQSGQIENVDITLICEQPKIGPHREKMQNRIAEILSINKDQISIKATTTEGLGFTGRGEGIAAQAIATIRLP